MAVTLYADWENGSYSAPTYTAATPDIPNGHTWTGNGTNYSRAVDNDAPWSGQTCLFVTNATNDYWQSTVSASEVQASLGRVLVEMEGGQAARVQFLLQNGAEYWDGRLLIWQTAGGNLEVQLLWQGGNTATVDLGTYPSGAYVVEVIYDTNNATASLRLRARTWTLGGSPGSFNNTGSSTSAGSQDQPDGVFFGDSGSGVDAQLGRVIISDDISEDLSSWSPGGGDAPALMGAMCL